MYFTASEVFFKLSSFNAVLNLSLSKHHFSVVQNSLIQHVLNAPWKLDSANISVLTLLQRKSAHIYLTLGCDVQIKYSDGGPGPYPVEELPLQI